MRGRATRDERGERGGTRSASHASAWGTPACNTGKTAVISSHSLVNTFQAFCLATRGKLKRKAARALPCRRFA